MKWVTFVIGLTLSVAGSVHADGTNNVSMTLRVLEPDQRMSKTGHEIMVRITNNSTNELWLADYDSYRVMLIAEDGSVLLPQGIPSADDREARSAFARRMARVIGDHTGKIAPHGVAGGVLRLESVFRNPIPTGSYWVLVTRTVRTWSDEILVAQPVRVKIE